MIVMNILHVNCIETWLCSSLHSTRFFFLATDIRIFWACLGLVKVERKLTNVQVQYLRQCKYICSSLYSIAFFLDYTMNKFPEKTELREIAKRWNCDNFDFYMDLEVSGFFLYLAGIHIHIFRNGFLVGEWLNKKLYNDEIRHEKLQLS